MDRRTDDAIEFAARHSFGKLVALVARATGDLQAAEDAVADALAAALKAWPRVGVPDNPDAWLLTAARRRRIDASRRDAKRSPLAEPDRIAAVLTEADVIPDDRLALLLACAHPAIDPVARTPMLLRCVLGVEVERIASAMLVSPAAIKQRLTRAKAKIRDAGIALEVPDPDRLGERAAYTLASIYAAFTAGTDAPEQGVGGLVDEAIDLARTTARLLPSEPEAWGLLALCLYNQSRAAARLTAGGGFVPLDEQDPALWDGEMIAEAEEALRRAATFGVPGRFQLEASIQSAHVARLCGGDSTWGSIVAFYDLLVQIAPSVGAAVARAAAIAEVAGAAEALAALDRLEGECGRRLATCQPYWAVRGDILRRIGERVEAADCLQRAIGLTSDPAVRAFLAERQRELF